MTVRTFKGNFFELGMQQGKIYRQNGMTFDTVAVNAPLYRKQLRVYERHYPEFLEELRGMTQGGGYDADALIGEFIAGEISWYADKFGLKKACTIFGLRTKETLYVGRNYDWHPAAGRLAEAYKVENPRRNSFIAVSDMGIGGPSTAKKEYTFYNADDAINDEGLFIGLTFAYADHWSYGLSCVHMMKLIAETCRTVEEALKIFKRVPLCCPKNFFIADKNGNMAVVEHTSKKYKVLYPKEGVLIQTNHYVDSTLAGEDTVLKRVPAHNTFLRYYETLQKINLKKDGFGFKSIIEILGTPGTYTCQNSPDIKTIWTLALGMMQGKYTLYWDVAGKRKSQRLII
jgi:predicted choloylglycine hydrolase